MKNLLTIFLLLSIIFSQVGIVQTPVQAVVSSCSASVSPSSIGTGSTSILTFTLNNTSSQTIAWAKFVAPSTNFTIQSGSASGWSPRVDAAQVISFTGTLAAGGSQNFAITVQTGSTEAPAASWIVRASDSSGGDEPTNCSGSTSVAITAGADATAPVISNITVTDVTATSVKITWTTDEASNSVVDYGVTTSYGLTKSDASNVTSHAVTLDNLSANTTYHYRVKSTDASSNTSQSADNTFVTAKEGATAPTQSAQTTTTTTTTTTTPSTGSTSSPQATPTPTPKPLVDTLPPVVSIETTFDKPFTHAPEITGLARDTGQVNVGVSKVEYSIDDGKNWLPVDQVQSAKFKVQSVVAFAFTPVIFEDGNYKVRVRAIDNSGNVGYAKTETLVIDRLPPQVGTVLSSIGPQVLEPNVDGVLFALNGLEQKITLSAVGGPTEIDVSANQFSVLSSQIQVRQLSVSQKLINRKLINQIPKTENRKQITDKHILWLKIRTMDCGAVL